LIKEAKASLERLNKWAAADNSARHTLIGIDIEPHFAIGHSLRLLHCCNTSS